MNQNPVQTVKGRVCMKLYEVTREVEEFLELVQPGDEGYEDTLDSLKIQWDEKSQAVAAFIGNLEANITAIKQAEKNMVERRKKIEAKAVRLKKYLMENMEQLEVDKIENPYFVATIKKNPPKVVIVDEVKVPDEFWEKKTSWIISKSKIKEALKGDGKVNVAGAELIQERRLEIK
ncbi:MAG: hypothetical protein CMI54_03060 [Parcubacteria group bacterium]|nr:hypothetical protein [Parcubacteria group bacterium]